MFLNKHICWSQMVSCYLKYLGIFLFHKVVNFTKFYVFTLSFSEKIAHALWNISTSIMSSLIEVDLYISLLICSMGIFFWYRQLSVGSLPIEVCSNNPMKLSSTEVWNTQIKVEMHNEWKSFLTVSMSIEPLLPCR